jgi:hypothetical protein
MKKEKAAQDEENWDNEALNKGSRGRMQKKPGFR